MGAGDDVLCLFSVVGVHSQNQRNRPPKKVVKRRRLAYVRPSHTHWLSNMKIVLPTIVAATSAAAATAVGNTVANAGEPKTNFVVLFADDFGWGDLSSFGHPTQEPGHLDEMATSGAHFTQWYSAESICTPSRMGLMTGCVR